MALLVEDDPDHADLVTRAAVDIWCPADDATTAAEPATPARSSPPTGENPAG